MKKTNELQNEGSRLTMQKELAEKMREQLTLTNKVCKDYFSAKSVLNFDFTFVWGLSEGQVQMINT